jgi:heterodisulfide reductase subunit C
MGKLYDRLSSDVRYREGLNACINCGTCTAICPAAEFYNYDPRRIANMVQTKDDTTIEELLRGDAIWYCGECMSCVTRCPRDNAPGLIILALRSLSQDEGFFTSSEKGRQQLALKRTIGEWILRYGYCVYPRNFSFEMHPEAGPVWKWEQEHLDDVFERLGGNLDGKGQGILRKIPDESLDEIRRIFDITGGTARFNCIEEASARKASEMGLDDNEYFMKIYNENSGQHS